MDGSSPADGGSRADASSGGDGYQGTVSLTHADVGGSEMTILGGFLTDAPDIRLGALPGCTVVRMVGPCLEARCPSLAPSLDGGELTASVGGSEVASASAGATGYFASVPGRIFDPGETITLATSGSAVPAFTADATAPGPLTTTPPTTFAPGTPLVLAWAGDVSADEVEVGLSGAAVAAVCAVPASDGTLTVDGAIMADFSGSVILSIKSLSITAVMAGSYRIAAIGADAISATIAAE